MMLTKSGIKSDRYFYRKQIAKEFEACCCETQRPRWVSKQTTFNCFRTRRPETEKKKVNKFSHLLSESDKRNISKLINKLSIKEIIKLMNKENKISKKLIYDYCLKLKNEN